MNTETISERVMHSLLDHSLLNDFMTQEQINALRMVILRGATIKDVAQRFDKDEVEAEELLRKAEENIDAYAEVNKARSSTIKAIKNGLSNMDERIQTVTGDISTVDVDPEEVKSKDIEEINIEQRTVSALQRAGINTVNNLINWNEKELELLRGVGTKAITSIKKELAKRGLGLANEDDAYILRFGNNSFAVFTDDHSEFTLTDDPTEASTFNSIREAYRVAKQSGLKIVRIPEDTPMKLVSKMIAENEHEE